MKQKGIMNFVINILITTGSLFLVSCNNTTHETMNDFINEKKPKIEGNNREMRKEFASKYEMAINKAHDSIDIKKLLGFYADINNTLSYMDSLKREMEKISDVYAFKVEQIFIIEKEGEHFFNKLQHSYTLIHEVARTEESKKKITLAIANVLKPNESKKWAVENFKEVSPSDVVIILSCWESGLMVAVTNSLDEY